MKLLRLKAAFGALQGEWFFDSRKTNLVVEDNESGKSTLLAAITAGLYGLDGDRRTHRVLTPLERYRPWTGDAFEVTLELQTADQRYIIHRDFARDSVRITDRSGADVTASFFEDRSYPVGRRLLGLDAAEFDKCAFLRHGDLENVVPGDEKARRASTLRARLENAADTHIGDTNASEALRVLEEALRRYTASELEFTGTIDNAIERLDAKRQLVLTELRTLEHDRDQSQGPLQRLIELTDEETALKNSLRSLEAERHAGLAAELRRQLDEDARALDEVSRLEEEARQLESVAALPANAEAELRETITRLEETRRNLETQDQRHRERVEKERAQLTSELEALGVYADYTDDEASRASVLAAEMRRSAVDEARLQHEVFVQRDQLAALGYEPERIHFLTQRFGSLSERQQRVLRHQSERHLAFQTEVAGLEQERTQASEALRELDAARGARRVPGWFALALGLGGALAGGLVLALNGQPGVAIPLLGGGGLVAAAGAALLLMAGGGSGQRDAALGRLSDAQQKLNTLRTQRAENEMALAEMAEATGQRDSVELLRLWGEYARMLDDSAGFMRAQEQLTATETRRRELALEAAPLMRALPQAAPGPETLETVAQGARGAAAKRQRLAELEEHAGLAEEEKRVLEAMVKGFEEKALRILHAAGLTYDPAREWSDHASELNRRMKDQYRRATVVDELLPAARRRLMPESEREHRKQHLAQLEQGREHITSARTAAEIDVEARAARQRLEEVQRVRTDLRIEFEEVARRIAQRGPELDSERARLEHAESRARRFKASIELARDTIQKVATDTHRRWADFLNVRVGELLQQLGSSVRGIRFGEDLDFSVQADGAELLPRGRASLQLSTGACDQLHIAVRLAISEFLTRGGESVPLLVDDAFATSDDQRLAAGMRMLIEGLGGSHQVILVTCHRGRHLDLQRLDPMLYNERVHWVDLRTPAEHRA